MKYDIICNMMRLVLDTDVVVSALRSPTGASAALLEAAYLKKVRILASVPLFFEYEAKCMAAEHWAAAGLTPEQSDLFVSGIAGIIQPVKTYFLWRPMLRDPNDEMVLEVAVNGAADAIVTFNQRDFIGVNQLFQLDVITPSTCIRRLRNE